MQCVNGHQIPNGNSFCGVCGASAVGGYGPPQTPPLAPGYAVGYTPQATTGLVQIQGAGTVEVATVGKRLAARAIDAGILIVSFFALGIFSSFTSQYSDTVFVGPIMFLFWLVFWLLYEWLLVAYKGATLGKMAMGVLVVDQRNGALLGLGPAFVRQLIPTVGALFFFLGTLLVYISPLFDSSGRLQGWHDKAANDLVIVKPN